MNALPIALRETIFDFLDPAAKGIGPGSDQLAFELICKSTHQLCFQCLRDLKRRVFQRLLSTRGKFFVQEIVVDWQKSLERDQLIKSYCRLSAQVQAPIYFLSYEECLGALTAAWDKIIVPAQSTVDLKGRCLPFVFPMDWNDLLECDLSDNRLRSVPQSLLEAPLPCETSVNLSNNHFTHVPTQWTNQPPEICLTDNPIEDAESLLEQGYVHAHWIQSRDEAGFISAYDLGDLAERVSTHARNSQRISMLCSIMVGPSNEPVAYARIRFPSIHEFRCMRDGLDGFDPIYEIQTKQDLERIDMEPPLKKRRHS